MTLILMNSIHESLFWNQVRIFRQLGFKVLMPVENDVFSYGVNYTPGLHDHPHFLGVVEPVHVNNIANYPGAFSNLIVWCGCFEQLMDAKKIAEKLKKPLLLYACTNNTPYTLEHGSHLLTEDMITFTHSTVPVRRFAVFPPDYDAFTPGHLQDKWQITTMIREYSKYWPEWARIYEKIAIQSEWGLSFQNYESLPYPSVPSVLRNSRALLHLKSLEGSGNSMMEALACGCPVIVNENLLAGRTCSLFLQPGFNCATIRHHMALEDFDAAIRMLPDLVPNTARSIRSAVREEVALAVVDDIVKQVLNS